MITILSLFSNRPDFIRPQYESLKKHLNDDFMYVVVNNAYFKDDKAKEIEQIAMEDNLGYIRVRHSAGKTDISAVVADTLNFLWKKFQDTEGILAIFDCDLFFTQPVSFTEMMRGYDMAFCPMYTAGKLWPWTGLMLFDMDSMSKDIDFGFESLNRKTYSDVGSAVNNYIEKHQPRIYPLDRRSILDEDWAVKDNETLYTLGFPEPYSVDIISTYQYPFLFHYKTSSNYAKHCTKKYNTQKTKALTKLLT